MKDTHYAHAGLLRPGAQTTAKTEVVWPGHFATIPAGPLRWKSTGLAVGGTIYLAEAEVWLGQGLQTCWDFVSQPENLPRFMSQLQWVRAIGNGIWQWKLNAPLSDLGWNTLVQKVSPWLLSWSALEGLVQAKGYLRLVGEGKGTRIRAHIKYVSPGGAQGEVMGTLFKDPQRQLERDLQKLAEQLDLAGVRLVH